MKTIVAVFILLLLLPATAHAQCTVPGCNAATAAAAAGRATGDAILTAAAPLPTATMTPAPTQTPAPTWTPLPTNTATMEPTSTPQPTATATATMQPSATPAPQAPARGRTNDDTREGGITPPVFFLIALAFLIAIALFTWIGVKALIKAVMNGKH